MSRFRRARNMPTWRKLAVSTWTTPHDPTVYGSVDVDMGEAMDYVRTLRGEFKRKVTVTHLVGKALADCIAEEPQINGIIAWKRIYLRDQVDIFFQVNTQDDGQDDLSGKKIERVSEKSLVELAEELRASVHRVKTHTDKELQKAKSGLRLVPGALMRPVFRFLAFLMYNFGLDLSWLGLQPDPFGSAMITSVGMLGIDNGFAPLIGLYRVPLIVVVGAVRDRAVVRDGDIVARPIMTLCGSFDHRFIDGAHAARMVGRMRHRLEHPVEAFGTPAELVAGSVGEMKAQA